MVFFLSGLLVLATVNVGQAVRDVGNPRFQPGSADGPDVVSRF
jgi:hypothetical protein